MARMNEQLVNSLVASITAQLLNSDKAKANGLTKSLDDAITAIIGAKEIADAGSPAKQGAWTKARSFAVNALNSDVDADMIGVLLTSRASSVFGETGEKSAKVYASTLTSLSKIAVKRGGVDAVLASRKDGDNETSLTLSNIDRPTATKVIKADKLATQVTLRDRYRCAMDVLKATLAEAGKPGEKATDADKQAAYLYGLELTEAALHAVEDAGFAVNWDAIPQITEQDTDDEQDLQGLEDERNGEVVTAPAAAAA